MSRRAARTPRPATPRRGPRARAMGSRVAMPTERTIASTTLLAFVVPALTVAALATVRPAPIEDPVRPPSTTDLRRATVVCAPALAGVESDQVSATTADPDASGTLVLRHDEDREMYLSGGEVDTLSEAGYAVLVGEDEVAPGLVAARYGEGAAAACIQPAGDQWFTGVGAGAEHTSVLELVNPDGGPAVADITVLGPDGEVEAPGLRGLTIRGQRLLRVDLAQEVPQRDELTVRVQVSRGRLAAFMVDRIDELGRGENSADWLPAQSEPRETSYLLGLGAKPGQRTLVVANGGADQARVTIRLVSPRSEFAPSGLEELVVPPASTRTLDLAKVLGSANARGVVGLRVDADQPVTATLRTLAAGDLFHAISGAPLTARAGLVLGEGPKRLVLAGAESVTDLEIVVRDGSGTELEPVLARVQPGTAVRVRLPSEARYAELDPDGVALVAAVESGPPGLAVVPLSELVLSSEVPDVRPALY